MNHKEDNREMVEEFLGTRQKRTSANFENKVQNYFESRRVSKENQPKRFEATTQENFEKEWKAFLEKKGKEAPEKMSKFLRSVEEMVLGEDELFGEDLLTLVSALENYGNLYTISDEEDLLKTRSVILEKLLLSKKSN